jgi:hypothetical protein
MSYGQMVQLKELHIQILINKQDVGIIVEFICLRIVTWRALDANKFSGSIQRGIFLDKLIHYQRFKVAMLYTISFSAIPT